MNTLADYYIQRNTAFLRQWIQLTAEGVKTREVQKIIAEEHGVSAGCVRAVYYDENYPYSAEAWELIRKENEAKKGRAPKAEHLQVLKP